MNKEEIVYWKWKNTIIDFDVISNETLDYDKFITKKDYVFRYLGIPDNEIHEWYNGGFSSEYNNALIYARQLGLVENYIDYENEIYELEQQCKKQKEINQKAIEYIKERFYFNEETGEYALLHTFDKCNVKELLDILNEVSK